MTLRERTQEVNAEYWEVREKQSERVAVAQLTLQFAATEQRLESVLAWVSKQKATPWSTGFSEDFQHGYDAAVEEVEARLL